MQLLFCKSAKHLQTQTQNSVVKFIDAETITFSNREMAVYVKDTSIDRSKPVYVIQATLLQSVNDQVMELMLTLDALRRIGVVDISIVLPYMPYSRQDRPMVCGYSVACKVIANMIGIYRPRCVFTVDIHNDKTLAFMDNQVINIHAETLFNKSIEERLTKAKDKVILVSLDVGGTIRTKILADTFKADYAIIDKKRLANGTIDSSKIIGDVAGKTCIVIDDIVDTGGTLFAGADLLAQNGAKEVFCYITHPSISNPQEFAENMAKSKIDHITTSNTINNVVKSPKITYVNCMDAILDSIKTTGH